MVQSPIARSPLAQRVENQGPRPSQSLSRPEQSKGEPRKPQPLQHLQSVIVARRLLRFRCPDRVTSSCCRSYVLAFERFSGWSLKPCRVLQFTISRVGRVLKNVLASCSARLLLIVVLKHCRSHAGCLPNPIMPGVKAVGRNLANHVAKAVRCS